MNNGDEHVSLVLAGTIYTIPRAAASKSIFLAGVLEMQDVDQVIPVPFVAREETAQVLFDFFHDNPIFTEQWPPRLCYDVLLAANGMDMPSLLELCAEEIAARWSSSTVEEIRATWGFDDNLTKKEKHRIQKENSLLEVFNTYTTKRKACKTNWAWPPEMLFLIASKLPTRELARMRGVCVELCDIIHSMPGRGDLEVSAEILPKNTNAPFVERHCLLLLKNKQQLESLRSLKNLQYLKIAWGINLGLEGINLLATLRNLKHLIFNGNNNIGVAALSRLKALQHLEIWSNNIGPEGAAALSCLKNLEELVIWSNNIGPEGAAALSALQNLKYLEIWNDNIGAEGARALSALQNLTRLVIGSNNIGQEGVAALSTLQNLTHLDIWENIGVEGAKTLSSLHTLKELVIGSRNNIGAEGAIALSILKNLDYLYIGSGNNIGVEGAKALSSLKHLQRLKILKDGNHISKTNEKELIELLPDTRIWFY